MPVKKVLIAFLLLTVGCVSTHHSGRKQELSHVVLCWLKEPGNIEHRDQIINISRTFKKIPGVLEVRAGEVISSDRPIVDDSFDVGILVIVPDAKSLQEYLVSCCAFTRVPCALACVVMQGTSYAKKT